MIGWMVLFAQPVSAACGPTGCEPLSAASTSSGSATAPVPPIDAERPAHVEIATFALG